MRCANETLRFWNVFDSFLAIGCGWSDLFDPDFSNVQRDFLPDGTKP